MDLEDHEQLSARCRWLLDFFKQLLVLQGAAAEMRMAVSSGALAILLMLESDVALGAIEHVCTIVYTTMRYAPCSMIP